MTIFIQKSAIKGLYVQALSQAGEAPSNRTHWAHTNGVRSWLRKRSTDTNILVAEQMCMERNGRNNNYYYRNANKRLVGMSSEASQERPKYKVHKI